VAELLRAQPVQRGGASLALGHPTEAEEQHGRAVVAAGVRVCGGAARMASSAGTPGQRRGGCQVEGRGDGEDAAAVGVAHGGLPAERRGVPAAAGHPGQPRARRTPAPRAAHHQVPTRDVPHEGKFCSLFFYMLILLSC
jgi:hypothetical protein